ncbi:MAG: PulJ/GspJ family protein, partial [Alphaproteobacteria bacterium]
MPAKKVRGFTLIEVLVAFTILALTLVVIFRLIAGNLSQERIIQQANSR